MFVVSEMLHIRINNPQLQPTDVTVTLLIVFGSNLEPAYIPIVLLICVRV